MKWKVALFAANSGVSAGLLKEVWRAEVVLSAQVDGWRGSGAGLRADSQGENGAVLRRATMKALPATTAFPADPSGLERPVLERHYLALRGSYKSLMMSRGQYRSRADKAHADVEQLRSRLITLAAREASVRGEVYAMLDLISTITGDLEDAGDDLVQEFGRYKLGRRSFQGGSFLGGLVQAVIRFINRWTTTKQRFDELSLRQQAITSRLEGTDVADPERKDGTDR